MKPYYEEDGIVIYNADCREILPTLPPVDLVLADPPYGMNALDGSYSRRYNIDRRNNWDCESVSPETMAAVMAAGNNQIIWGMNYFHGMLPPCKKFLAWHKTHVAHLETRSAVELAYIRELADMMDDGDVDEEVTREEFAYCCTSRATFLDINNALENLTEEMFEDAMGHLNGLSALQDAVDAFNEVNKGLLTWDVDYSRKVRIQPLKAGAL